MCSGVAFNDIRDALENSTYECAATGIAAGQYKPSGDGRLYESMHNRTENDDKNLAAVLLIIGEMYQYNGNYAESIPCFDQAITLNNKNAELYHYRAESYLQINDMHMAIENFRQEIALEREIIFPYSDWPIFISTG